MLLAAAAPFAGDGRLREATYAEARAEKGVFDVAWFDYSKVAGWLAAACRPADCHLPPRGPWTPVAPARHPPHNKYMLVQAYVYVVQQSDNV